jgi:hypothetical protein
MRLRLALAFVLALPAAARAHVAPATDANNRYLKATLLPGEVRLSFTLFLGEIPGALERRRMDRNGDNTIDAAEARAAGERLLGELGPGLVVTLDGAPRSDWAVTDVGLGQPSVRGGALSIDLGLTARYRDPSAAEHTLVLDDHTVVTAPGESETRVEESPGVRIATCHLPGVSSGIELRFPFTGNAAAPGERAVTATFSVDEALRPVASRRWPLAVAVGALLLGAAGFAVYRKVYG